MHARILAHGPSLDHDSPAWRTALALRERGALMRTWLNKKFGTVFASGKSSRRIIASHRGEPGAAAHHES